MVKVRLPTTRSQRLKTASKTIARSSVRESSQERKQTPPKSVKKESTLTTKPMHHSTPRRSSKSIKESSKKAEVETERPQSSTLTPARNDRASLCRESKSSTLPTSSRRSSALKTPRSSRSNKESPVAELSSKVSPQKQQSESEGETEEETEWEVEEIQGKRFENERMEYWVKWVDYSEENNTWEPLKHLTNCQALLKEFNRKWVEDAEVEKILEKRIIKGVMKYKIKWAGWAADYNTWEPEEHLTNCQELLEEFNEKWRKEKAKRATGPGRGYTKKVLGIEVKRAQLNSDGEEEEEGEGQVQPIQNESE